MQSARRRGAIPILAIAAGWPACTHATPVLAAPADAKAIETFDLADLALRASGIENERDLEHARASFESAIAPIVEQLQRVAGDREQGRVLLASLHAKGGLLARYDARATTLRDVLEERRFNCVSASVLYNLIARRLGLAVGAELLPTHARTLLSAQSERRLERVIVETTSPHGFAPSKEQQAQILRDVAGSTPSNARAIVEDTGAIVDTEVLIGAIYVNRASIAQEHGDLVLAEHLFARGEALVKTDDVKQILRDQRASLLSQLAVDDMTSGDPARFDRSYRTLRAAVALESKHTDIRRAVAQNLRAIAERLVHRDVGARTEAELVAFVDEAIRAGIDTEDAPGLRAFLYSEISRVRSEANDFDGALAAIERAFGEAVGPAESNLVDTVRRNRATSLRLVAHATAKKGDYDGAIALLDRAESTPRLPEAMRGELASDRVAVLHLVGNRLIENRDFAKAADLYRMGVERHPNDVASRHNLVASLERSALLLVDEARCDRAEAFLREIRSLDPKNAFPDRAAIRCATRAASQKIEEDAFDEAVAILRDARRRWSSEPIVVQNLEIALVRWAAYLSKERRCNDARRLVSEARALEKRALSKRELDAALSGCR